jgi:CheY-like chemotaxis protein
MAGTILVVDDETTIRELVRAFLEDEGYEVATAACAAEALGRVEAEKPALVFSDVAMPGMSGLELCASLRGRGNRVPLVLMSASYGPDLGDERVVGCDGFLSKPFDLDELLRVAIRYAGLPAPALVARA